MVRSVVSNICENGEERPESSDLCQEDDAVLNVNCNFQKGITQWCPSHSSMKKH